MTVVLQISDLHFGCESPAVQDALTNLAHRLKPDLLIISGDITQRATRDQFRAARRFCDGLRVPRWLSIPGNHDIPLVNLAARIASPYERYIREFGPDLSPVVDFRDVLIVGVNTTRKWRHKNGAVSPEQVSDSVRRLRASRPEQLRIVVTHQPSQVIRDEDIHDRLIEGPRAASHWSNAGADLLLGGHIHLPYLLPLHEQENWSARRTWVVQAGTAVSVRTRWGVPNSVNVIRCDATGATPTCFVERWDYLGKDFAKVLNEALPIQR